MRDNYRDKKWLAALLLAGTAVVLTSGLAGCKKKVPVDVTAAESASAPMEEVSSLPQEGPDGETSDLTEKDPNFLVRGSSGTMVESGGSLFFKYDSRDERDALWRIDKKTGEMELLYTFGEGESNSLFWYDNGSLYFDAAPDPDSESGERIGLYQLKLRDKKVVRLTDLGALPTSLYAADGILYVRGYGMELYYALKEDGSLGDELRRENTIYAKVPAGGEDLFKESLPALAKRCGYLAARKNGALVLADLDGSNERSLEEVTDFYNLLFGTDRFFTVLNDGEQRSIVRYDLDTLEPVVLAKTEDYPTLLQYYDGRVYYMVNDWTGSFGRDNYFYALEDAPEGQQESRQPESGQPEAGQQASGQQQETGQQEAVQGETEETAEESGNQGALRLAATMSAEPGTTGFYGYYGNFYLADGSVYCQKIKDYGVYIRKFPVSGTETEETLLEPTVYQSGIRELGHVEAEKREIPCECGEKTAAQYYVEKLVLDGDSEAVKNMNRVLEAAAESQVRYGENLTDGWGEEEVHDEFFSMPTLQYEIGGVTYLDSRYVCVEADGSEYMGGAHGMPYREYFIFDRENGKQLELSDIISTPEDGLKKIVAGHFREYAKQTNGTFETPEELEQTVIGRVNYRFPFYLTEKGVVFYFTPYDIAPYAAGFPEVTVPYSELELKIQIGG